VEDSRSVEALRSNASDAAIARSAPPHARSSQATPDDLEIKRLAAQAYQLFVQNPQHPLRFKPVRAMPSVYSVRIGLNYRALGEVSGNDIFWFWIGTHADYTKLIP
jgi:hypothetical protein